jgi:hypothetical protein
MRRLALLACLLANTCWAQSSANFQPAVSNVWGAEYPRVDGNGRVQVRIEAPEASKVRLNVWSGPKVDMAKQPDGFWTVTTEPLVPGFHYYTIIVDGAEVSDPGSQAFFGGGKYASAVEVPEAGSTYYLPADVPHGQVREVWYHWWLGVGTVEPPIILNGLRRLHASLDEARIKHVYYESPGTAHEWQTWRRDLKDFVPRLF